MDVLLSSWVFLEHMTDDQRLSVMTASSWRTAGSDVTKILLAHGGSPPQAPVELTRAKIHIQDGSCSIGHPRHITSAIDANYSVEVVRAFLQAGADPHDALHHAVQRRRLDIIHALIVDGMVDKDGGAGHATTPLVHAFRPQPRWMKHGVSRLQVIKLLLELGADPNACGTGRQTPLVTASLMRDHEMLKVSFQHGADPNIVGRYGHLPLSILCGRRIKLLHFEFIKLLLAHGADPNCAEWQGNTVLHRLVSRGRHEMKDAVIKLLITGGGNMHLPNEKGITPLNLLAASAPARLIKFQKGRFSD